MREELGEICRDLVALANAAPPGPVRDRMQADLVNLRRRLESMPGKVAGRVVMKSAAEVQKVLDEEIRDAFRDVLHWTGHVGTA